MSSKIEREKENSSDAESKLKIIDLNDDCLWHIFEMLDFDDLVNVGVANSRLAESVTMILKKRY